MATHRLHVARVVARVGKALDDPRMESAYGSGEPSVDFCDANPYPGGPESFDEPPAVEQRGVEYG